MARILTNVDAHAIMNLLVKQATGQSAISVVDASTFVSAGELVMATGTENVMDSITLVLGKMIIGVRPYSGKFKIMNQTNTGLYSHRLRKISYYAKDALAAGGYNTNLYTNLADGYDNNSNSDVSVKSMWEQHQAIPLEMNFSGSSVWDDCITRYENQLQQAFSSETDFIAFVTGYIIEKGNDMESQKEIFSRMTLLNYMAGLYDIDATLDNGMALNMTKAFNDRFGTSYTTTQLLTAYVTDFMEHLVATLKVIMMDFSDRNTYHHWSVPKTIGADTYHILRHTPENKVKAIMNGRVFAEMESRVFPEVFHPDYLKSGLSYELINYWQSQQSPLGLNFTPAIPDINGTGAGAQGAGDVVDLALVLGVVYDEDALMVDFQMDYARTTPVEARKGYTNTWYGMSRNAICDFTEKGILLYMADPVA